MVNSHSLADYSLFIKAQIQLQEKLLENLFKMEAQIKVILMVDLNECPAVYLYNYLWILDDLLNHARDLNEKLLNSLIRVPNYQSSMR